MIVNNCDCDIEYVITSDGFMCPECNTMSNYPIFVHNEKYNNEYEFRTKCFYKRKTYLSQKLKQLVDINIEYIDDFDEIVDYLKTFEIDSVSDLKSILKLSKLSKYYKYIYGLYYHVTNERLLPLTDNDISKIQNNFRTFETKYKMLGKRNLTGYNVFLYITLRDLGFQCYKNIILPNNVLKKIAQC